MCTFILKDYEVWKESLYLNNKWIRCFVSWQGLVSDIQYFHVVHALVTKVDFKGEEVLNVDG